MAPGSDAIPAEIYKAGSPPAAEKLAELFHIMWRKEAMLQEIKDAKITHLFTSKGNPQICDNYRVISLLSVAGKILARVLLNRLNEHLEQSGLLQESQCGFRKDIGTIDMIFTPRQLQEKCQEQTVDLYMNFVDLTKAFDSVSCKGLWKIMAKFGCPAKFIAMVHVPRWYACKGPKWWWVFVFWSISCVKCSKARLCTSFNAVQHDVFCHPYRCFPGRWQWHIY